MTGDAGDDLDVIEEDDPATEDLQDLEEIEDPAIDMNEEDDPDVSDTMSVDDTVGDLVEEDLYGDDILDAIGDGSVELDAAEEGEVESGCLSSGDCDDLDPCTVDTCGFATSTCLHEPVDVDGDGFIAMVVDGSSCAGDDCDDGDPLVNPSALEVCDLIDNNCNTYVDEAHSTTTAAMLSTDDGSDSNMSHLAWTGSEYGVVWSDRKESVSGRTIRFLRLSADGVPVGSDLRITDSGIWDEAIAPSLEWTGSTYGLAWVDDRHIGNEIYFVLLSPTGAKLNSDLRVSWDTSYSETPSLVATGSEFGIAWMDGRVGNAEIFFSSVSQDGTTASIETQVSSDGVFANYPSMAWTGSEFCVMWSGYASGNAEIYFGRVASDGTVRDSDLSMSSIDLASSTWSSLVWTGSELAASWRDSKDGQEEIYFARFSPLGSLLGSEVRVTTHTTITFYQASEPDLFWTGTEFGLNWNDDRDGGSHEIYFTRLSGSGVKIEEDSRISHQVLDSIHQTLVWTGSEYATCWQQDLSSGEQEVLFSRIELCI